MFSPKTPFLYLINFLEVKPTIESDPIMTKESGDGGSWVTEFGQITVDTESDFDEVSSDDITITSESSVSTMVSSKPVKAAAGGPSIPVGDRISARPVSTKLPRSFSRGVRAAQPRVNRGGLYSEVSTPTRVSFDFIIFWAFPNFFFFSASGTTVCTFITTRACAVFLARWTVFSRSRSYGLLQPSA